MTIHDADIFSIPETDQLYLGPFIDLRLREINLSRRRLAVALGVNASIVDLWVREKRPVPHLRLESLAEVLQVPLVGLLSAARVDSRTPKERYTSNWRQRYTNSPMRPHEVVIPSPIQPRAVQPSQVPLAWCTSDHGTGQYRRHHHGVLPVWGRGLATFIHDYTIVAQA